MNNTKRLLTLMTSGVLALNTFAADVPDRPLQVLYLGETTMGGGGRGGGRGGGFGGARTNYVYLPGQTLATSGVRNRSNIRHRSRRQTPCVTRRCRRISTCNSSPPSRTS